MRTVNLLTKKYSEQAGKYTSAKTTTTFAAVVFLLWLLIVLVSATATGLMRASVYRNAERLSSADAGEAARLHRLAAEARGREERASRYFPGENMNLNYLGVIAEAADGLRVTSLELDNRERLILVGGEAPDSGAFTAFEERLRSESLFYEISLSELERRDGRLFFLLELKTGYGQ